MWQTNNLADIITNVLYEINKARSERDAEREIRHEARHK